MHLGSGLRSKLTPWIYMYRVYAQRYCYIVYGVACVCVHSRLVCGVNSDHGYVGVTVTNSNYLRDCTRNPTFWATLFIGEVIFYCFIDFIFLFAGKANS